MKLQEKVECNKLTKVMVILYISYNFIYGNFVNVTLNDETLAGGATFGINGSILGVVISGLVFIGFAYLFLKGYKTISTLLLVGAVLNVVFALMSIETSNFSMYNVHLIIIIALSVVVAFLLRKKA